MTQHPVHPSLNFPLPKFQDRQLTHPSALLVLLWEVLRVPNGRTDLNRVLTQHSLEPGMEASEGRGDGLGGTRDSLSGLPGGFGWTRTPPPRQSVRHLPIIGSSLQLEGGEIGTHYWKATWQRMWRASKIALTSTSSNFSTEITRNLSKYFFSFPTFY